MTVKELKRRIAVIFSAATLSQLKKAGLKYWKNTPTFLKALATLVIALNAAWQLYSRFFFPEKPSVTVPPSAEVGQEKVTPQSPGKASKL